jgi:hypothetical protein
LAFLIKATLLSFQEFQRVKVSRVLLNAMVSTEAHVLTVRNTQNVNTVLSEEVFEIKFQKECVCQVVWEEIVSQ